MGLNSGVTAQADTKKRMRMKSSRTALYPHVQERR